MNKRGKSVDTTRLDIAEAGRRGWIHRDYIAHVFRWEHVFKMISHSKTLVGIPFKDIHILDIGCGHEAPLASTLFFNKLTHTGRAKGSYTGVDYGTIAPHPYVLNAVKKGSFKGRFLEKFDAAVDKLPRSCYDVIVCLEMLEHVEAYHAFQVLRRIHQLLPPSGVAFISTPCFDPKVGAADNHVCELSWHAINAFFQAAGLSPYTVHGTFASQKDYKPLLNMAQRELFERLNDYHDSNVVALIFAPLFPEVARNCLWRVKASGKRYPSELLKLTTSDGSSLHFSRDIARIQKDCKKDSA